MFVEKNTTGAEHQASVKIASGDIVYTVMVTQTAEELASVRITEAAGSKLETKSFDSIAGESQSFIFVVEWFPRDWNCDVTIEEIAGNDPLKIETGSIQEETLSGGRKVYELQLSPFEAAKVGETLANKFVFTVRDSSGELGVYNRGVN